MEIDNLRIHKIVEYLKLNNFDIDYFDLANSDLSEILEKYGISDTLSNQEKGEVFKELLSLIEESEFKEIENISNKSELEYEVK